MTFHKFQPGTIIEIEGAEHTAAGYSGDRLLLIHRVKGTTFQCEQPDKSMALPTDEQFDQLLIDGTIVIRTARSADKVRNFNEKAEWALGDAEIDHKAILRATICDLLDGRGVANGNKSIELALKEVWTHDLIARFGPAPAPRTIRSWRTSRGHIGNRHPRHMVSLTGRKVEDVRASDLNKQIMWLSVLRGLDAGSSVAAIHADYAATIDQVNDGIHPAIQ